MTFKPFVTKVKGYRGKLLQLPFKNNFGEPRPWGVGLTLARLIVEFEAEIRQFVEDEMR